MISSQIAEAFVKISAKGFEAVKQQYAALGTFSAKAQAQLNATAKACERVGSAARVQFAIATTAMIGFAAAASPGDALKLEAALGRLTVQVGSLFLPVIRQATSFVEMLTAKLRELTPEQREQIGQWAKLGLGILAVVGVGSKLLSFLPGLVSGIGAVGAAVKSLVGLIGLGSIAATGWGAVIIAVVAALGSLAAISVFAAGKTESVGKSFTKVWDAAKRLADGVWSVLKPLFAAVGTIVAGVLSRVGDVVSGVAGLAASAWETVGGIMSDIMPVLQELAAEVMSVVDDLTEALAPVAEWFRDELKDALKELAPVIKSVLGGLVDFMRQTIREMRILARVMQAIVNNPLNALDIEGVYKDAKADVDADDERRRNERAEDDKPKPEKTKSGRPQTGGGVQSVYKPELFGISDVLRRAQTAGLGESREMAMNRERLELQKRQVRVEEETRDAVRGLPVGLV